MAKSHQIEDSSILIYKGDKLFMQIDYIPNFDSLVNNHFKLKEENIIKFQQTNNNLNSIIILKGNYPEPTYIKYNNHLQLHDSLGLLGAYISDIETVIDDAHKCDTWLNDSNIVVHNFRADFRPMVLSNYGIPESAFLDSMQVYVLNGNLIMDKFYFKNITVVRKYYYHNGLIKSVSIKITRRDDVDKYLMEYEYEWTQIS